MTQQLYNLRSRRVVSAAGAAYPQLWHGLVFGVSPILHPYPFLPRLDVVAPYSSQTIQGVSFDTNVDLQCPWGRPMGIVTGSGSAAPYALFQAVPLGSTSNKLKRINPPFSFTVTFRWDGADDVFVFCTDTRNLTPVRYRGYMLYLDSTDRTAWLYAGDDNTSVSLITCQSVLIDAAEIIPLDKWNTLTFCTAADPIRAATSRAYLNGRDDPLPMAEFNLGLSAVHALSVGSSVNTALGSADAAKGFWLAQLLVHNRIISSSEHALINSNPLNVWRQRRHFGLWVNPFLKLASCATSGDSAVVVNGSAYRKAQSSVSGDSTVSANGRVVYAGAASISGDSVVTPIAQGVVVGNMNLLDGLSDVVANAVRVTNGVVSASGDGTVSLQGTAVRPGQCNASGDSSVAANATAVRDGKVSVSGDASLVATARKRFAAWRRVFGLLPGAVQSGSVSVAGDSQVTAPVSEIDTLPTYDGSDDGFCTTGSNWSGADTAVLVGRSGATTYAAGYRFRNVPMLQGQRVVSAILRVYHSSRVGVGLLSTRVKCVAADDAPSWDVGANPINLTKTVAFKDHTAWTLDDWNEIDVTGPVQEVINRAGWVRGNAIGVCLNDNGSDANNNGGLRTVEHSGGSLRAELVVTYPAIAYSGPVAVQGDATLIAPATRVATGQTVIQGDSSVIPLATSRIAAVVATSGDSVVAVNGTSVAGGSASIDGDATTTVNGTKASSGVVSTQGDANVLTNPLRVAVGTVLVQGDAVVTANGVKVADGKVSCAGDAVVVCNGQFPGAGAAVLVGDAEVAVVAVRVSAGVCAVSGDSVVTCNAVAVRAGSVSASGDSKLVARARKRAAIWRTYLHGRTPVTSVHQGNCNLQGDSVGSCNGLRVRPGASAVSGDSTVVSNADRVTVGASVVAGHSVIVCNGTRVTSTSCHVVGDARVLASPGAKFGRCNLAGESDLVANGVRVASATIDVEGDSESTVNGQRVVSAQATSQGDSVALADATAVREGVVSITGDATVVLFGPYDRAQAHQVFHFAIRAPSSFVCVKRSPERFEVAKTVESEFERMPV